MHDDAYYIYFLLVHGTYMDSKYNCIFYKFSLLGLDALLNISANIMYVNLMNISCRY